MAFSSCVSSTARSSNTRHCPVTNTCLGFEIYMYSHSFIVWNKLRGEARQRRRMYIIIGALSVLFTGMCAANNAVFMQFMWIERRDTPGGGPLAFLEENSSIWYQVWGTAAAMVTNFMGDALLVSTHISSSSTSCRALIVLSDIPLLPHLASQHLHRHLPYPSLPRFSLYAPSLPLHPRTLTYTPTHQPPNPTQQWPSSLSTKAPDQANTFSKVAQ